MARAADNFSVVLVMVGTEDEAIKIAASLVEERLAACVNVIGPARSIYRWQGKVEDASEYLLIIKARAGSFPKVAKRVSELHSYDVPEIIAVPLTAGVASYLKWLADSTAQAVTPRVLHPRRTRGRRSEKASK